MMKSGKLRTVGMASGLMRDHYVELAEAAAAGDRKIAWCSSVGPAELLRGMGFLVYFPENHAAMLGAGRTANDSMDRAGALGYSADICSYLRSDIGAYLAGETPLTRLSPEIRFVPRPDVLVFNTNQCRDVKDWFTWYSRQLGVPCIGVEGHCNVDVVTEEHVRSIGNQLRGLVPALEAVSGRRLDPERLAETVALSGQCSELWEGALRKAAHRPSPLSFVHALTLIGPVIVGRGTQGVVDFLTAVHEELDERIRQGVAAVKHERYRIYWEGMPIWGRLSFLTRLFMGLRVCPVASTFCNSWIFGALDPAAPFESMARAYTELFIVRSDAAKERYLGEMVREYGVDGIVFHDAKTCPHNSNSRYGMPARLRTLGIPSVTVYGDHNDATLFSEARAATQIEAFVEQLALRV